MHKGLKFAAARSAAFGVIHKPRGQLRGEGGLAKWQFYNISLTYLVKVTTEGGQKYPKIWPRGLWMTPYSVYKQVIISGMPSQSDFLLLRFSWKTLLSDKFAIALILLPYMFFVKQF